MSIHRCNSRQTLNYILSFVEYVTVLTKHYINELLSRYERLHRVFVKTTLTFELIICSDLIARDTLIRDHDYQRLISQDNGGTMGSVWDNCRTMGSVPFGTIGQWGQYGIPPLFRTPQKEDNSSGSVRCRNDKHLAKNLNKKPLGY